MALIERESTYQRLQSLLQRLRLHFFLVSELPLLLSLRCRQLQDLEGPHQLLRLNLYSLRWSGQQDLNLRPPAPKAGALPGCAMPREFELYILKNTMHKKPSQGWVFLLPHLKCYMLNLTPSEIILPLGS